MPTNTYDAIVLGDDLAGLIAATLCARRGMRVLVAETPSTPADRIQVGPYALPRTPLAFAGEPSPAVRRVIAELNFIQSIKRRLVALRPSFQVVLPDARIDVSSDNDALARELSRELGDVKDDVIAFAQRAAEVSKVLEPVLGQDVALPPDGFWERREMARHEARLAESAAELVTDERARAFVALPAAFLCGVDPRALTTAAIARAFDLWRRGASRLDGGRDSLRAMMIEKLRTQHAGEVRQIEAAAVVTKWGRAQGLTLRDRDETLGCGHLIIAQPVADFGDLFGERRPKRIAQLGRAIRPTAYRYVLNLVVAEAGIPEGIAPLTFAVFDPAKPLVGDNAIALHVGEPDDDARVLVTVVANAAAPGDGENLDDLIAALRPRVLARVEEIMPFSAEHVLLVHSPNQARVDGIDGTGKLAVFPPEPLWSAEPPHALGVGALPYDLGLRGVTSSNAQNLPGLGIEGEFASGWCAARAVCNAVGKKKDYLKDEVLLGT